MEGISNKNDNSENYLKSAIRRIYGEDDDFIVFGLTGRTGSGCSTVAKTLQSPKNQIRHSLFDGTSPKTNEDRKQRIICRHFETTWFPFLLIQVRAIITTFILDNDVGKAKEYLDDILRGSERPEEFFSLLARLQATYRSINEDHTHTGVIDFYTNDLDRKSTRLK